MTDRDRATLLDIHWAARQMVGVRFMVIEYVRDVYSESRVERRY